jgi:transposase-like protein
MSVRDIEAHLSDLYGVQIGRDTISRVTDAVLEDVQTWRTRPLDRVYPIAYCDCLMSRCARTARSQPAPAIGDRRHARFCPMFCVGSG